MMEIDLKDEAQREEFKKALGEAIDAWLDKQFARFGKYSIYAMGAALFAWIAYLYLLSHGWKPA